MKPQMRAGVLPREWGGTTVRKIRCDQKLGGLGTDWEAEFERMWGEWF